MEQMMQSLCKTGQVVAVVFVPFGCTKRMICFFEWDGFHLIQRLLDNCPSVINVVGPSGNESKGS